MVSVKKGVPPRQGEVRLFAEWRTESSWPIWERHAGEVKWIGVFKNKIALLIGRAGRVQMIHRCMYKKRGLVHGKRIIGIAALYQQDICTTKRQAGRSWGRGNRPCSVVPDRGRSQQVAPPSRWRGASRMACLRSITSPALSWDTKLSTPIRSMNIPKRSPVWPCSR